MFKYLICHALMLCCLISRGSDIEIRYHVPKANQVTFVWGVNDWNSIADRPPGTKIKNSVMHSPMFKEGDDFVLRINIPDSNTIDYLFKFNETAGPFKIKFEYTDRNEQPDKKYYHTFINGAAVIRIRPDFSKIKPDRYISVLHYTGLFLFLFSLMSLLLFACKKFIYKGVTATFRPALLFLAIPLTLLITLMIIRAYITGVAVQFLFDPLHALPLLFKTAFQDLLYTILFAGPPESPAR